MYHHRNITQINCTELIRQTFKTTDSVQNTDALHMSPLFVCNVRDLVAQETSILNTSEPLQCSAMKVMNMITDNTK